MTKKQTYLAPAIKVVAFSIEKGFAGSNSSTESLSTGNTINMGGSSNSNPAPSSNGFFSHNNENQAIDSHF